MGLFDTIVFPRPVPCSSCGTPIVSTQTHELGESMSTYRVGDVASWSPFGTGVLTEGLYCEKCRLHDQKVHITIWHGLITGVYEDQETAEARLLQVDRADILNHLIRHQKQERKHRRALNGLLADLERYIEYLKSPEKLREPGDAWDRIFLIHIKKHLDSADPLASIVAEYKTERGDVDRDDGFP